MFLSSICTPEDESRNLGKTSRALKPVALFALLAAPSFLVSSCGSRPETDGGSDPQALLILNPSSEQVAAALSQPTGLRVNLKLNSLTLYRQGVAVDRWNIVSADVTGDHHDGEPQVTPLGVFNADRIVYCPSWRPSDPVNPETGRKAQSEAERQSIFRKYPNVYGACGKDNPLGRFVLWFQGPYGLHGTNNEGLLNRPDPESRRLSGGCVRNPNAKIKGLMQAILTQNGYTNTVSRINAMEQDPSSRGELTTEASDMNLRVVVGRWNTDPALNSDPVRPDPTPAPTPRPTPIPTPTPTPVPTPAPTPVNAKEETLRWNLDGGVQLSLSVRQERVYRAPDVIQMNGQISLRHPYKTMGLQWQGRMLKDAYTNISTGAFTFYFRENELSPGTYSNLQLVGIRKDGRQDVVDTFTIKVIPW